MPFDRQKIKQGLEKACWKRPVSDEQLELIVSSIETEVHGKFEAEVESSWLGELLMQHLRQVDQVAYVRFASVYREFQDARDFVDELEPMLAEKRGDDAPGRTATARRPTTATSVAGMPTSVRRRPNPNHGSPCRRFDASTRCGPRRTA